MQQVTLTRKELYDLVWSKSLSALSKEYNISDVGLRKLCLRWNIPIPNMGHWEKLKHGKLVEVKELLEEYDGKDSITLSLRGESDLANLKSYTPLAIREHEIRNASNLPLTVPAKLSNPDKLIRKAKDSLLSQKPSSWRPLVSSSENEVDIVVTPKNVGRSLRFMDTFIKLLRSRGHDIKIERGATYACILEQEIKISFKELQRRELIKEKNWERTDLVPTGILTFRIEKSLRERMWKDGTTPIEDQLPRILAKLELLGSEIREESIRWQKWREEQAAKLKLEKELAEQKENELLTFQKLLNDAKRHREAMMIREYINSFEKETNLTQEKQQYFEWARRKADWYDPHVELVDECLSNVDKTTLTFRSPYFR